MKCLGCVENVFIEVEIMACWFQLDGAAFIFRQFRAAQSIPFDRFVSFSHINFVAPINLRDERMFMAGV